MIWHSRFHKHLAMSVVPVFLLIGHSMQAAPLTVTMSVTPNGANYLYDFAITNQSATDPLAELVSVDFNLPGGSVVGMATAPAGNGAVTDPSASVDFVEFSSDNLKGFALGTKVDGFQFTDSKMFSSLPFLGNYLDSTEVTFTQVSGTTTAAVPEPATLGLLSGASLLLFSGLRRLRRR